VGAGAAFAACAEGITVHPEIMFPLVCSDHEIEVIAPVVREAASAAVAQLKVDRPYSITYRIGTMLEGWLIVLSIDTHLSYI
jgi:hypothetical protein